MTTPIDVADLISLRPMTIPIDYQQIVESCATGGTTIAPRRSWFRRVWDSLTRREVARQPHEV